MHYCKNNPYVQPNLARKVGSLRSNERNGRNLPGLLNLYEILIIYRNFTCAGNCDEL